MSTRQAGRSPSAARIRRPARARFLSSRRHLIGGRTREPALQARGEGTGASTLSAGKQPRWQGPTCSVLPRPGPALAGSWPTPEVPAAAARRPAPSGQAIREAAASLVSESRRPRRGRPTADRAAAPGRPAHARCRAGYPVPATGPPRSRTSWRRGRTSVRRAAQARSPSRWPRSRRGRSAVPRPRRPGRSAIHRGHRLAATTLPPLTRRPMRVRSRAVLLPRPTVLGGELAPVPRRVRLDAGTGCRA